MSTASTMRGSQILCVTANSELIREYLLLNLILSRLDDVVNKKLGGLEDLRGLVKKTRSHVGEGHHQTKTDVAEPAERVGVEAERDAGADSTVAP